MRLLPSVLLSPTTCLDCSTAARPRTKPYSTPPPSAPAPAPVRRRDQPQPRDLSPEAGERNPSYLACTPPRPERRGGGGDGDHDDRRQVQDHGQGPRHHRHPPDGAFPSSLVLSSPSASSHLKTPLHHLLGARIGWAALSTGVAVAARPLGCGPWGGGLLVVRIPN
jgi:hypothetical protein